MHPKGERFDRDKEEDEMNEEGKLPARWTDEITS